MINELMNIVIDQVMVLLNLPIFIRDYLVVIGYGVFASLVVGAVAYGGAYIERKLIARIQLRYGPQHPGPAGILINLADFVKLISKEDIVPDGADSVSFRWAPIAMATILFFTIMLLPFGKDLFAVDQSFSLLLPVALLSLLPVAILLIGWASNSKYTYLGALRSAVMSMSYEIPLLLSVVGLVILTGTLNIVTMAEIQDRGLWFVLLQPIGLLVFVISMIATAERIPFDMPFAESELVAGWKTEYSGVRYALTFLVEYGLVLVTSVIVVFLFFGGWSGPTSLPNLPFKIPSEAWLFFKVGIFVMAYIVMRASFPRLRADQLLNLCWKYLIPLGVLNIGIAVVERMVLWV